MSKNYIKTIQHPFGSEEFNNNLHEKIEDLKKNNRDAKPYIESLHKSQIKELEGLVKEQKKIEKQTNTVVPVLYINNRFKIQTPNRLLIGKTPTNAVRNDIQNTNVKNEKKPMNLVSLSFNGKKIIPATPVGATPVTSGIPGTAIPGTATPGTPGTGTATPGTATGTATATSPSPKNEDQLKANIKKSAMNTISSTAGKIRSVYANSTRKIQTSTHKIQTNTLHKLKGWKNYMTRKVKNVSRNIGALK